MNADHWKRLDELFQHALDLPREQRDDYLEQACGGAPQLRREVAAMLAADDAMAEGDDRSSHSAGLGGADPLAHIVRSGMQQSTELRALGQTHGNDPALPSHTALPFTNLGPYRLVEELGRGGLATVYLAERDDAQFTMQVAIKLVRRGFDTPDLLERLRLERQILARLEHPNIARLIDGGTAPDGRPYFVMERIEGQRIDDWCDAHGLDLRQRLELFQTLCDAVHNAHRRLVLHRDIKPSNILVTGQGVPKLLDFGIAKLLDGGEDEAVDHALARGFSTLTSTGMRLLTPEFASPEQVRGETLTTASDVYSLGVLLYLLITGRPPYTFDRRRPAEVERVVCEQQPERPSAVVWSQTDSPDGDARRLNRAVLGWPRRATGDDLDTIVRKALRKEPERRYGSVIRLAEDLRCYLNDLPVSARPDSMGYRTGKFVRRHRLPVAAAAVLLCVLVGAVVVTSWQARVADRAKWVAMQQKTLADEQRSVAVRQQAIAELQQRRAEETSRFMEDLFEVADPYRTAGETLTVREVLDQGAAQVKSRLADDPLLRANLLATIGRVYQNLSLLHESEALLTEALELRRRELEPGDPQILESRQDLVHLWLDQERFGDAEGALEELVAERRQRGDAATLAAALYDLAMAKRGVGNLRLAEEILHEALAIRLTLDAPLEVAQTRNKLATLHRQQKRFDDAEQGLRRVLAVRRELLGDDHPDVALTMNDLAVTLQQRGELATAETLYRETLAMQRRLFGEQHQHVISALHNLISVLWYQAKIDEALSLSDQHLRLAEQVYGVDHPSMARALYLRSQLHHSRRDYDHAIPLARRARKIHTDQLGDEHPTTLRSADLLASLLVARRDGEADGVLQQQLAVMERVFGPEDHRLAHPLSNLARVRLQQGDLAAAEGLWRRALTLQEPSLPADAWQTAATRGHLGNCLRRLGRLDEARTLLISSHRTLLAQYGADHPRTRVVADYLEALADATALPEATSATDGRATGTADSPGT